MVNRLLCAVDKSYKYTETNYIFDCNGITYKLKTEAPVQIGWKEYDKEYKEENISVCKYTEGNIFTAEGIKVKEIEAQPPKHYTDATLLSVMSNIDNRIDDKELKSAVSGKGIGTEATRAEVIEDLIRAGYAERNHRNIVSTQFGRDFIASIPDSVKSVERTAEWEQIFTNIKEKGISAEPFIRDVKDYVRSVIELEKSPDRNRTPVHSDNPNSPKREPVGICPRCGKNIYEGKKNYYCESGKDGCGFTLWKEDRYNGITITSSNAFDLLSGKKIYRVRKQLNGEGEKKAYVMVMNGKYANIRDSEEK